VAYNRNLMAGRCVSPEQLGKWAVLLDRWPEAGRAIVKHPDLAATIEAAADQPERFESLCVGHTLPLACDIDALRAFFRTPHPLAEAAYHLAYLDAGPGPGRAERPTRPEPAASDRRPARALGGEEAPAIDLGDEVAEVPARIPTPA
jgi:hypothetical protein